MKQYNMDNNYDKLVGYVEISGMEDERELLSIADDGTVEGGEFYKGHELDPNMLFVIIRNAEKLCYKGRALRHISVQADDKDPDVMEVWLDFSKVEDK